MIKIILGSALGCLLTVLIEAFMFWLLIVRGKSDMNSYRGDIEACMNKECKVKWQCLRWQIALSNDPNQTYILGRGTNGCEFQIKVN